MTDLFAIDYKDAVRAVVRRRLKEIGIKVPKIKLRTDCKIDHVSFICSLYNVALHFIQRCNHVGGLLRVSSIV